MCRHQYNYAGHLSHGDNLPGYAQGEYFPGDEPGLRCRLTEGPCTDPAENNPEDCAAWQKTPWFCPVCLLEEEEREVLLGREGAFYCPACEGRFAGRRLAALYAEGLLELAGIKKSLGPARAFPSRPEERPRAN